MNNKQENNKMNQITTANSMPEEFREIAMILQLDAQLLGDYSVKAVNGRNLQSGLGNVRKHTTWAQQQIAALSLVQGKDYEILSDLSFPPKGSCEIGSKTPPAQTILTYCFTVDAAKTIAMISKSSNGATVRNYFLHMEKVAQSAYRGQLPALSAAPGAVEAALEQATRFSQYLKAAMGDAWGQGYHQKVTHEQFQAAERHFGVSISHMLPAPTVMLPGQAEAVSLTEGVHFQEKAVGSKELSAEEIKADLLGGVSLNDALEHLGMIKKMWSKKKKHARPGLVGVQLTSTADPRIATSVQLGAKSAFPGQFVVKAWHWNAFSKDLREALRKAAEDLAS